MEEEREKATELIKSGRYYDEALRWYSSRYIFPKTQVAYLAVLACVAIFMLFTSLTTTMGLLPLESSTNIVIQRPTRIDEAMALKSIGEPREEATIGYLKFLLSEYVRAREEYSPQRLERDFNFVVELSNDEIFMNYLAIADQSQNPDHPVWKYGSQVIKNAYIRKIQILGLDKKLETFEANKQYQAIIDFDSSLIFEDNLEQKQKMQAEISFKFEKIIVDQNTNAIKQLPKLQITAYKTKQL